MIGLLNGQIKSADPDLRARQDSFIRESLQALQTFVLKASSQLWADTDCWVSSTRKIQPLCLVSHRCCPTRRKSAASILHAAFQRFDGHFDDYNRAVLAMALWNLEGQRETRFILDWFYNARRWAPDYTLPHATYS